MDYQTTPEELRAHFAPCGTLDKVTIICDKHTGMSKGFAYIKFADETGVENALKLDNTPFKGRQLKVNEPVYDVQIVPCGNMLLYGRSSRNAKMNLIAAGVEVVLEAEVASEVAGVDEALEAEEEDDFGEEVVTEEEEEGIIVLLIDYHRVGMCLY